MSEINKGLDLALFNQDGKHCACMILDFLGDKRIPHDVSILATAITFVALCYGKGMNMEDIVDIAKDIFKSYKKADSNK